MDAYTGKAFTSFINKRVAALGGCFSLVSLHPPASDKSTANFPIQGIALPGAFPESLVQAFHTLQTFLFSCVFLCVSEAFSMGTQKYMPPQCGQAHKNCLL